MRVSSIVDAIRMPVVFTLAMWIIIFGMMVAIEAIEYLNDHLLVVAMTG